MADLAVPIDITVLNNTSREMQPKIVRLMMQNIRNTFANFTKYPGNVRSSVDLLTFDEGSIMQPYDPTLGTSKTLGTIDKRTLSVNVGMSFIKDEVERYRNTYMAALDELNISSQAKLPFAAWYLETIAMVGLNDLFMLPYKGVKGVGTTPVDITDGFLKIIADEITANKITTGLGNLSTLAGAASDYTSSTLGDELKLQWNLFPQLTQEVGVNIHIPYRYKQMYKEWFKAEYTNITDGDVPTDYLDGTDGKAKFIWTSAMGTSKRVIMTTQSNLVYGVDQDNQEFGKILVFFYQNNPYILAATNKSVIGFQIRTLDAREFNVNNLA